MELAPTEENEMLRLLAAAGIRSDDAAGMLAIFAKVDAKNVHDWFARMVPALERLSVEAQNSHLVRWVGHDAVRGVRVLLASGMRRD